MRSFFVKKQVTYSSIKKIVATTTTSMILTVVTLGWLESNILRGQRDSIG
jgi:hypothetical protein